MNKLLEKWVSTQLKPHPYPASGVSYGVWMRMAYGVRMSCWSKWAQSIKGLNSFTKLSGIAASVPCSADFFSPFFLNIFFILLINLTCQFMQPTTGHEICLSNGLWMLPAELAHGKVLSVSGWSIVPAPAVTLGDRCHLFGMVRAICETFVLTLYWLALCFFKVLANNNANPDKPSHNRRSAISRCRPPATSRGELKWYLKDCLWF